MGESGLEMYDTKFSFNGTNRRRELPRLPRAGEVIDLDDGENGRVILRIDLVIHRQDGSLWEWHCNCTEMKNWREEL
jgi:hypothetical protein